MELPVEEFEWGDQHTVVFDATRKAAAHISKVHYYDANRETRIKRLGSYNRTTNR